MDVFAAFYKDDGDMAAYAKLVDKGSYVDFTVLRAKPKAEGLAVNAAIIYSIVEYYRNRFDGKFFISDGERSIRHETAFQDYLEKYFEFRKAYCKLNIKYRRFLGIIVAIIYPFRNLIRSETKTGNYIHSILKLEYIKRSFYDHKQKE